ncbi:MAG: hypothetical protein Q9P01_16760 [Anaerolineae bacterium]|nr:hypothetical protein [Anaerolineae bacterium]MDQ7036416.1 hypothetical protein [Anaerolineae bacterium]
MQTLKGDNYIVRYDEINCIFYGIYDAVVTTQSTAALYIAASQLLASIDINAIRGIVMDFRRVERFDKGNIVTVQRENHTINHKFDLSHIPVALVVDTPLQEQIVDYTSKVTPDHDRKQIVFSIAEAYIFFDEWHQEHCASA